MTAAEQSGEMDAKRIAERHVIERYLAGQLDPAEADAFDAYLEAHPEVVPRIEEIARMKAGLGVLQRRGELTELLREPRSRAVRRPAAIAIAACVVLIALFILLRGIVEDSMPSTLVAASFEQLQAASPAPLRRGRSFSLARTRELGVDVDLLSSSEATPEAVELRLASTAGTTVDVELLRVQDNGLERVARLSGLRAAADGTVTMYISAAALEPGSYVIRQSGGEQAAPVEYTMRLRAAEGTSDP